MAKLVPILGALLVLLGAFGSHALPGWLIEHGASSAELGTRLGWWSTATQYGLLHTIVALIAELQRFPRARWLFVGGIFLFSGSLYAMTLTGVRVLGAVTPLGGIAFVLGWLEIARCLSSPRKTDNEERS